MQIATRLAACAALFALGSPAALGQGQVWIVDEAGGPGADFTEVQPAVDAAADGDTVLVRSGTYESFTIDGKALVVTSDASSAVSVPQVEVANVAAGKTAAVRGMTLTKGCRLYQNDGLVWLEALVMEAPPSACALLFAFAPGLTVQACSAVIATRCTFVSAEPGIEAFDSNLYLFGTTARAVASFSGEGAPGVRINDSFLFASGGVFKGGCGAGGGACSAGDQGGAGLVRNGGPPPQILKTALVGGPGGCGVDCPFICAPPGASCVGGCEFLAGFARGYVLASPAAAGQTTTLAYDGKAGDLVFSLIALSPSALYLPDLAGALVLAIPPILISHGPADGEGDLQALVPLPPLPPGVEAFTVYAQGAAVSAVGAAVLGTPSQLSIL